MKKLTYKFSSKLIAVFLYTFMTIAACISGIMVCGAFACGFYSINIPRGTTYMEAYEMLDGYGFFRPYDELEISYYGSFFRMRYISIVLLAVSIICIILLFIFLMAASGKKEGEEKPQLNFFDKIPFDVFFVVCALAVYLIICAFAETLMYSYIDFDVLIAFFALGTLVVTSIMLIILGLSSTFAARVKAGKWWRNTVISMVLRFIFRCIRGVYRRLRAFFHTIPIVWKTAVVTVAVFLFLFIVSYDGLYRDANAPLFLLAACIIFVNAVLASYQLKKLKEAGERLAAGDLETKTDTTKMFWDFKKHGENLNSIGDGMARAVEHRMRSERLKTELITNVSHDIKTPLTSIVNYVDLLSKAETEEEKQEYIEVLARQAERLRKLTEDLIEASKASTGSIAVNIVPTNTTELINQALGEYTDKLLSSELIPIYTAPEKPVTVMADGKLLWRVMDNLLSNAVKYAQPGTRLYVDVTENGIISFKNISRDRLNVSADELMERFVRGDASRSTSGSGLGLNIAKSLMELMGGELKVTIDGDLFKAELWLRAAG